MKRTFAAAGILLLLIGISLLHIRNLKQLTQDLCSDLHRSMECYGEGNFSEAESVLRRAMDRWDSKKNYARIVFDHDTILEIDDGFFEILQQVKASDNRTDPTVYEKLQRKITQLAEDEQLFISSIF